MQMSLGTLAKNIAYSLGFSELSEFEIATLADAVSRIFGYEITEVASGVGSQIQRFLPAIKTTIPSIIDQTISQKLAANDPFSSALSRLIAIITEKSNAKRADEIAFVFCWIAEGLEEKPTFAATMSHL